MAGPVTVATRRKEVVNDRIHVEATVTCGAGTYGFGGTSGLSLTAAMFGLSSIDNVFPESLDSGLTAIGFCIAKWDSATSKLRLYYYGGAQFIELTAIFALNNTAIQCRVAGR